MTTKMGCLAPVVTGAYSGTLLTVAGELLSLALLRAAEIRRRHLLNVLYGRSICTYSMIRLDAGVLNLSFDR